MTKPTELHKNAFVAQQMATCGHALYRTDDFKLLQEEAKRRGVTDDELHAQLCAEAVAWIVGGSDGS